MDARVSGRNPFVQLGSAVRAPGTAGWGDSPRDGGRAELPAGMSIVVGSDESATLRIHGPDVSPRHAGVWREPGSCVKSGIRNGVNSSA